MMTHRFSSSDGVGIGYEEFGAGNSGTPLVFCHGVAVNGAQFHADAEWFAARGHRVLVPHLRGHGLSNSPAPLTRDSLSITRLAADMVELLDHAGVGKVHWVGNSLGGIVALAMLPAGRFETLATFGTSYSIKLPMAGAQWLVPAWHRALGADRAAAVSAMFTSDSPKARLLIDSMLREMRIEVVAALLANLNWYDMIAAGERADLPILMLHCGRDRLVNVALWQTVRRMRLCPNFRLMHLPTGGHCANLDVPDAFRAALVTFWDSAVR